MAELAFSADVAYMELPDFLDGYTLRDRETGTVLIAIAVSDNPERQRFSTAHELGHLAFGHLTGDEDPAPHGPNNPADLEAHGFARHLLLPREELANFIRTSGGDVDLRMLSDIVDYFRVSAIVAVLQLRRFGHIDDATADVWADYEARDLAARYGWDSDYSARVTESLTPRPPKRMLANVTDAYVDHIVPAQTVAAVHGSIGVAAMTERLLQAKVEPRPLYESPSLDDL